MNAATVLTTNNILFVEQVRIDYEELRSTFSDYEAQFDHVMVGIMHSINDNIPTLSKYYSIDDCSGLTNTIKFVQSVAKYVSTPSLTQFLIELKTLAEKGRNSGELKSAMIMTDQLLFITSNSIKNLLYYSSVVMV